MSIIKKLVIKNYRGIKYISIDFDEENLVCFIGRGDSGKTTILEAISSVLSPRWNLTFYDTDFYNCLIEHPIEIEASIINFPDQLLSDDKYGLHARSLNIENNEISDDIFQEHSKLIKPALTIKLVVDRSLEPQWTVTNTRDQADKPISATDRARINCTIVSDYIDRHFSWNKGNPLFSLLKEQNGTKTSDQGNVVIDYLRKAKGQIDKFSFEDLEDVTEIIKNRAAAFGLNLSGTHTTLDFKELAIKDGRISLHEKSVPFRLKGKGSKRIASFAIQSALVESGGIMLVDEIEQGLEPDRVKHLVRTLKEKNSGQIFLTTHSREVVTELNASSLALVIREEEQSKIEVRKLGTDTKKLQKAVRACSEAFFAKKVIVCEGRTEIGICRAMDRWRLSQGKNQMSFEDCAYVDGNGSNLVERARGIQGAGITTTLFCDSDDSKVNKEKQGLSDRGVNLIDCEADKCIEQQVFTDLPWDGVKEVLEYADLHFSDSFRSAFSEHAENPICEWRESEHLRNKIVSKFERKSNGDSGKSWFKTIHTGEKLGCIIFKYLDAMNQDCRLRKNLISLSDWIDR